MNGRQTTISSLVGCVLGHTILYLYFSIYPKDSLFNSIPVPNELIFIQSIGICSVFLVCVYFFFNIYEYIGLQTSAKISSSGESEKVTEIKENESKQHTDRSWKGFRSFQIDKIVEECADIEKCKIKGTEKKFAIKSFYLKPFDNQPIVHFKAGQYLTFRLDQIPGQPTSVIRCYSLSDSYENCSKENAYRITIKREETGLVSKFFHDNIVGDNYIDVKEPTGKFCLKKKNRKNVVLIAAGVGLTPILSMLKAIVKIEEKSRPEVWLFYTARNGNQHPLQEEITNIFENHKNVHPSIWYSKPNSTDKLLKLYHYEGRMKTDEIINLLPSAIPLDCFDFYLCGPADLMRSLHKRLAYLLNILLDEKNIVDEEIRKSALDNIHLESFGPSSLSFSNIQGIKKEAIVTFGHPDKAYTWTHKDKYLLEFAHIFGIKIKSGCRTGSCGTCLTNYTQGKLHYPNGDPGYTGKFDRKNYCLPCVCIPNGDVTLVF